MRIIIILIIVVILIVILFITTVFTHGKEEEEEEVLPSIKNYVPMEEKYNRICYFKGDVIANVLDNIGEDETRILLHICNNKGGWGAGFVLALSKKWKTPEKEYRECFRSKINHELGDIQIIEVEPKVFVVNMVAQNGYKTINNPTPLDYNALEKCFQKVLLWIDEENFTFPQIYCPKIGTGLSGGDWNVISEQLNAELGEIPINVYEI